MVDFKALDSVFKKRNSGARKQLICVLGVRGSGKSAAASGTWGDKKVLLLQFSQESHAETAAMTVAKHKENIFSVTVDIDEVTGAKRNSLATFKAMDDILNNAEFMANFNVVVIDSLAVVDVIICEHPNVTSVKGYDTKRAADSLYDSFIQGLVLVRNKGLVDIVITCPTELRGSPADGMIEAPTLRGASAVNNVIGACDTILFVKRDVATKDGEEVPVHVFDMRVASSKSGTKVNKQQYVLPIEVRVSGIKTHKLPPKTLADFSKLSALQEEIRAGV